METTNAVTPPATTGDSKIFLWGVSLLSVAVFAGAALAARGRLGGNEKGMVPEVERRLVEFQLTERSGRTVNLSELRDKFLVVNFVHTGCSISCALVNQRMAEVQKLVAEQNDVQLLSLTVDPGTDSPAVLTKFAKQFGADAERWLFLTGDRRSVYQLIETSFLSRDTNATHMEMPGGFRKADHIALVDRDGKVRRYFPGMKFETPGAIIKAIEELRAARRKY
ncbi:MAG: SCO family protein [Verrucomicrobia bacterium]|nr:SCO family protein [Verrucomicrobiota bacterium]